MTPARGRDMIDFVRGAFGVSVRKACRAIPACRSTYHYRSRRPEQAPLRKRIREIAETRMRYGYRRITVLLRRQGWHVNVKRVHRLYRLEGLQMRFKPPRRRVMAKLRDDRSKQHRTRSGRWIGCMMNAPSLWLPTTIRVDQGSQFTSKEFDLWAYANGITLDFSRPGKPTDNAYVESFNATVRLECLGRHWFLDLDDAREKIEEWRTA